MKMNRFLRPKLKLDDLEKSFFELENKMLIQPRDAVLEKRMKKLSAAVLWYLDQGLARVWDPEKKEPVLWVKKSILHFFKLYQPFLLNAGVFEYWDKLPIKKRTSLKNVRVVPGAVARYGSFIEAGCILMPSLINVGAHVGKGTMVDTWATVGSCAQIGAEVHLSGGVGIGGVLEPPQANPVVIEDGAFIGSRCIVVEGMHIGKRAVLGAGVVLTASTKIIDVRESTPQVSTGFIPENSVVIPGSLPKEFPAGQYHTPCALIIGSRTASTDLKTSLNEALRNYSIAI